MKLISIIGRIWDLTISQDIYSIDNIQISLTEANKRAILGKDLSNNGTCRILSNHHVRSKAKAIIQITVSDLIKHEKYDIYHSSKGFYCNVQGQRIYLENLLLGESK